MTHWVVLRGLGGGKRNDAYRQRLRALVDNMVAAETDRDRLTSAYFEGLVTEERETT